MSGRNGRGTTGVLRWIVKGRPAIVQSQLPTAGGTASKLASHATSSRRAFAIASRVAPFWASACRSGPRLAGLGLGLPVWASACRSGPRLAGLGLGLPVWASACRSGPRPAGLGLGLPVWASTCRSGPRLAGLGLGLPVWASACRSGPRLAGLGLGLPVLRCVKPLAVTVPGYGPRLRSPCEDSPLRMTTRNATPLSVNTALSLTVLLFLVDSCREY